MYTTASRFERKSDSYCDSDEENRLVIAYEIWSGRGNEKEKEKEKRNGVGWSAGVAG